jgi:hypothetical protein
MSTKVAPIEIFRDPRAEKLVDVRKFNAVSARAVSQSDIDALKAMAGDINANVNLGLINSIVDAMAAKLTDHANIQSLIEVPAEKNGKAAPTPKGIQEATTALLQPLFEAKAAKNQAFLTAYNRVLLLRLAPLLKNHLIPRIQASIVLGQSANPDALRLFMDQIKDEKQTIWVKLWAMEGIANIVEEGIVCLRRTASMPARSSPIFSRMRMIFPGRRSFARSRRSGRCGKAFGSTRPRKRRWRPRRCGS